MGDAIRTDSAPAPVGAYPHARRVGDLLFLSGVGPRTPGTNTIPGNVHDADGRLVRYDIEAQCRQVFANVRAVLEASGAHWEDLVDVTVFLTDMTRDFATYNRVYAEYFEHLCTKTGHFPAPLRRSRPNSGNLPSGSTQARGRHE